MVERRSKEEVLRLLEKYNLTEETETVLKTDAEYFSVLVEKKSKQFNEKARSADITTELFLDPFLILNKFDMNDLDLLMQKKVNSNNKIKIGKKVVQKTLVKKTERFALLKQKNILKLNDNVVTTSYQIVILK